ncbi:MAG: N-6 DNA methylase [Candidatus Lokiarchaeota archaeon]|nr:N-6 DNA methylase [Candidatus Lokiarchaeota archaeon]
MTMQEEHVPGGTTPDEIRLVTREQRREKGIYYTPVSIARFMALAAIERWLTLAPRWKKCVKILDPACGDGVFLLEVLRALKTGAPGRHAIELVEPRIHGVDVDGEALRVAAASISRVARGFGWNDVADKAHLAMGNALGRNVFHEVIESGGFDIVIGNPPYIPWNKIPRAERAALEEGHFLDVTYACRRNHADAQPNYYLFFIVLASSLINEDGVISFLLPQEWLYHERAVDFRRYLLDRFKTIDIGLFPPGTKIFSQKGASAGTTSMILTLGKVGSGGVSLHTVPDTDEARRPGSVVPLQSQESGSISRDDARHAAWILVDKEASALRRAILRQPVARFDDPSEFAVHGGFQPPVDGARQFEIDEHDFLKLGAAERDHVFPLVHDAREIRRYVIAPGVARYWIIANSILSERVLEEGYPGLYSVLKRRLDTGKPFWWHFPNVRNLGPIANTREKVLAPRTAATPCFALDDRRSVFKGTNTMIIPKRLDARYVVGVLNSKLAAFWQQAFGFGYHGGAAKKLEPSKARKTLMPVSIPSPEAGEGLAALVNEMIARLRSSAGTSTVSGIQQEIDAVVYDLYGIDGEMKERIDARIPSW